MVFNKLPFTSCVSLMAAASSFTYWIIPNIIEVYAMQGSAGFMYNYQNKSFQKAFHLVGFGFFSTSPRIFSINVSQKSLKTFCLSGCLCDLQRNS